MWLIHSLLCATIFHLFFEKESPIECDIDGEGPAGSGSIHDETSERSAGQKSKEDKYIEDFYDEQDLER